jgi:hypothetical protein
VKDLIRKILKESEDDLEWLSDLSEYNRILTIPELKKGQIVRPIQGERTHEKLKKWYSDEWLVISVKDNVYSGYQLNPPKLYAKSVEIRNMENGEMLMYVDFSPEITNIPYPTFALLKDK